MISFNSCVLILESSIAVNTGALVFSTRDFTKFSSIERVINNSKCNAPVVSFYIKGKFISVCILADNSIFAFSYASYNLCIACLSLLKSFPFDFLNPSTK